MCYRCGGKHAAPKCRFKSAKCYKCSKVGHLASVCRSKVVESNNRKVKVMFIMFGNQAKHVEMMIS